MQILCWKRIWTMVRMCQFQATLSDFSDLIGNYKVWTNLWQVCGDLKKSFAMLVQKHYWQKKNGSHRPRGLRFFRFSVGVGSNWGTNQTWNNKVLKTYWASCRPRPREPRKFNAKVCKEIFIGLQIMLKISTRF